MNAFQEKRKFQILSLTYDLNPLSAICLFHECATQIADLVSIEAQFRVTEENLTTLDLATVFYQIRQSLLNGFIKFQTKGKYRISSSTILKNISPFKQITRASIEKKSDSSLHVSFTISFIIDLAAIQLMVFKSIPCPSNEFCSVM